METAFLYSPLTIYYLPAAAASCSRSRMMVRIRASCFFSSRTFLIASTSPSASLKFKRKSDSFKRAASAFKSSSDVSCRRSNSSRLFAIKLNRASFLIRAPHKLRLDRKFLCGQAHRFTRRRLVHTFNLVKNTTRLDDCHPVFGSALAFAHAGFRRLLGNGLIREHPNPDFSAALDVARHSNTRCFNLTIRNPRRL